MKSHHKSPVLSVVILLLLAMLACQLPESTSTTPKVPSNLPSAEATDATTASPPQVENIATPTTRPTAPPQVAKHRIGIHRIYGISEFYDRTTSQKFIPRGVNYFILVPISDHYEDRLLASGVYDHTRTQADFAALTKAGYNTLRISLDGCTSGSSCVGLESGQGLNPDYLNNLADLMILAKEADLYLLLTSNGLPELGGYAALANQGANASFAEGRNAEYLTQDGIQAAKQYWADLLGGLAVRKAPFDNILGWELISEQYYESDQPPFSMKLGTVTPANGKTYTMSSPVHVRALAAEGMRYYISQLHDTILTYDPTALISMGFFAPDTPNPWREGDGRLVDTASLLSDSTLDFFDLHASPGDGLSMAELAQNFGLGGHVPKPIVMGDVGASTWTYPQLSDGAIAVQDWIAASCSLGYGGWVYSNYYPSPAGLAVARWGFVDEQNLLLNALAPDHQPDACTNTVLPGRNLSVGKTVQASEALPDQTAQMAVDGDPNTQWSAGAYPTQWIQIDLGAAYDIGEIKLTVGQWPAGEVVQQVWAGSGPEVLQMVQEFTGKHYDFDILDYAPQAPLKNIRYVRIVTTESPSWVSWREIEVLAPFPATPTPTLEAFPTPTP